MAHDIMGQFYTCLNLPLQDKLVELTRIIDQSSPTKDLQALFPQLINNIFASTFNNGWGIRTITCDSNRREFEILISFLEPLGPMFRLCYKLLSDPQLTYDLPLNVLPLDLQMTLERGRCPQFYADMLATDPQSFNVVALALNPFDYYIFNFALHLVNNNLNKSSWENWNSVYFALACDYLMHFLPTDPNVQVLPHIPNYTGKVPMAAPLQAANRQLYSPSLLLIPDLSCSGMSNQHTSQSQSRNEVWRSETVLQVFIDIWMSVEAFNAINIDMYQRNYPVICSSPERVRTVRVLVKHLHSFSAKHFSDSGVRTAALRKYSRQALCPRAHRYVRHLVATWPLDASFRLVLELWLSLLQPWRYVHNAINQDRFPAANNNQEEGSAHALDASFIQFIAENFPSYTSIFQLVLPRFMRLDLTAYKNAVMLFRLGKVFSQPDLVPILWNLEQAITDTSSGIPQSPDTSYNSSSLDQSYTYNGVALHKWVTVAKQAISELNMITNFEYEPMWNDNMRQFAMEVVKKILAAKFAAEKHVEELRRKQHLNHQGFWARIQHWLMISDQSEEELLLEESKKVPQYLNSSVHYISNIFGLNENTIQPADTLVEDNSLEHSSFINSTSFPLFITSKLRSKPDLKYMGDPDLMPIMSYESTILVRMLYQISCRVNELYQDRFVSLWNRNDYWGYVAREVLEEPCRIQRAGAAAGEVRPARLSLRRLASRRVLASLALPGLAASLFSCTCLSYLFFLFFLWALYVLTKAALKMLRVI